MNPLFRHQAPSPADIDSFHNDGYIFYPDVLTDVAREGLIAEIYQQQNVQCYLETIEEQSADDRTSYFVRPWNDRGPIGHQLIDDPFVLSLIHI